MSEKKRIVFSLTVIFCAVAVIAVFVKNRDNIRLEITAVINAKDNYECEVDIGDDDIVKFVKKYSLNEKEHFDDGKSHINFVFEGLKQGRTTVTIKCTDTLNKDVLSEDTYKISVNKKLDTSICFLEK